MDKKLVGLAVGAAAVLAVVTLVQGRADPPATEPPAPTPTAAAAGKVEAYDFPDAAGGRGWSIRIPVPADWTATRQGDRASYRRGDVLLETDRVPITQEDALSGLRTIAAKSHYDGSVVTPAEITGLDAAEWNFTYLRDGTPERVTVVGLGAGDALVTIRYEAPPAEFERDRGVLAAARNVSAPG